MINYTNDNSAISYTNKDFQTIYPELLDTVKKLTYKWDPTISNESDPGVILIKLNALIADKLNYNIDKNVLECFPQSVTQDINARNLYQQLGYTMKWYRAATTSLMLACQLETELPDTSYQILIPKYSMVSDTDNSVVYTMLQDVIFSAEQMFTDSPIPAIQGTINDYLVNGNDNITIDAIDSDNRLYFTNYNVAENGIFIKNSDDTTETLWTAVENLAVESLGNKYYEFGVDARTNTCYIEFPYDIDTLIGSGLTIKYITTAGVDGNISSKTLTNFYNEVTPVILQNGAQVVDSRINVTPDQLQISQIAPGVGGENPETLEIAYRNYRKTIGVFNTLITLRDYMDKIYTTELASNSVVTDRYNDIQTSYQVVTLENDINTKKTYIEKEGVGLQRLVKSQSVPAFDSSKYYIYCSVAQSQGYVASDKLIITGIDLTGKELFCISNNSNNTDIVNKVVTVEYSGNNTTITLSSGHGLTSGTICTIYYDGDNNLFTKLSLAQGQEPNKWANIYTDMYQEYFVDKMQAFDLKLYLLKSVDNYNTTDNFNDSFKLIPSDNAAIIESELMTQNCVQHNFKSILPDKPCIFRNVFPISCRIITSDNLSAQQIQNIQEAIRLNVYQKLNSRMVEFGSQVPYDQLYKIILDSSERIKTVILGDIKYTTYAVYWDSEIKDFKSIPINNVYATDNFVSGTLSTDDNSKFIENGTNRIITAQNAYKNTLYYEDLVDNDTHTRKFYKTNGSEFEVYSDKLDAFRTNIIAKSVLNGNTQLYIPDALFTYRVDQQYDNLKSEISDISTALDITINSTDTIKLDKSEEIQLCAPSFSEKKVFSNYVKYYAYSNSGTATTTISANAISSNYNEIVFFYMESDNDNRYRYERFFGSETTNPVTYIKPNFQLTCNNTELSKIVEQPDVFSGTTGYIPEGTPLFNVIKSSSSGIEDLSGNKTITTLEEISVSIPQDRLDGKKSVAYCYWITNIKDNNNYKLTFTCLYNPQDQTNEYQHILDNDEYFIYTDANKLDFEILGGGTRLSFATTDAAGSQKTFDCKIINALLLDNFDIDKLKEQLVDSKQIAQKLKITQQEFLILSEGNSFKFSSSSSDSFSINSDWKYFNYPANAAYSQETFRYTTGIGTTADQELPGVPTSGSDNNVRQWQIRSILNIETTYQDYQQFSHRKSESNGYEITRNIAFTSNPQPGDWLITETSGTFNGPLNVLSDVNVSKAGGNNIDVSYLNIYGDRVKPSFYVFTLGNAADGAKLDNNIFTFTADDNNIYFKYDYFKLQENSNYLLHIYVDDITDKGLITVKYNNTALTVQNTNSSSKDLYYNIQVSSSSDEAGIEISALSTPSSMIKVFPLFKYEKNTFFKDTYDISFDSIRDEVMKLDISDLYAYTYIVPEKDRIEDPLYANSFFDSNHICNKFTIPQATFSTDIQQNITKDSIVIDRG